MFCFYGCVMVHLHFRRRTQVLTPIRIPKPMATLYNAENVHIAQTMIRIPAPCFCTGQNPSQVCTRVRLQQCKWAITPKKSKPKIKFTLSVISIFLVKWQKNLISCSLLLAWTIRYCLINTWRCTLTVRSAFLVEAALVRINVSFTRNVCHICTKQTARRA